MAELVPEDDTAMWTLKTHSLMKDVLLQDGDDQQADRPGRQRMACPSPRHRPQLLIASSSCWEPVVSIWT